MDHYFDITLNADAEMPLNVLCNLIYTKLHKALYDLSSTAIGISFPNHKILLGNVIRLHGCASELEELGTEWIGGLKGYCRITEIREVPKNTQFRTISRKQTTMSASALRRLMKRGSIPQDDIKEYRAKMYSKGINNPFVEIVSCSNGRKYRRYIQFGEILADPASGTFDYFGLSKTATIPWF
jgi:CRISPR-associated endonuclease Csy4